MNISNCEWLYDDETGHYIVRNSRILYQNFAGEAQDYNPAGKRNFRLAVPDDLADELRAQGLAVRTRPPRDENDDPLNLVKISVYSDAEIRFLSGRAMSAVTIDNKNAENDCGAMIDREFRKGHARNGDIKVEFHISRNTQVPNSAYYARLDVAIIPIRKSRLMSEIEDEYDED